MSVQTGTVLSALAIVGIVVIGLTVGFAFTATSSKLATLSSQDADIGQQLSNQNEQIFSLNQEVSMLQQRTIQVVTVQNTIETVLVETTTSSTTYTVTSVTAVPDDTLVMINSSYDNSTSTFTFEVQNTQNYTVYAQLQATVMCITRPGAIYYCPNPVGTYTSGVTQFSPRSTTNVSFNLSNVDILSSGTKDQIQIYFEVSATQVSPTYTLQYP